MTMLTKSAKEKKQKNIITVYKSHSEGLSLGTLLAKFSNFLINFGQKLSEIKPSEIIKLLNYSKYSIKL